MLRIVVVDLLLIHLLFDISQGLGHFFGVKMFLVASCFLLELIGKDVH